MAILRGREVQIESIAYEIDGSTFNVRYLDGETDLAKMHELSFTRKEYEQFVKPVIPDVSIIDEPESTSVEVIKPKAYKK